VVPPEIEKVPKIPSKPEKGKKSAKKQAKCQRPGNRVCLEIES